MAIDNEQDLGQEGNESEVREPIGVWVVDDNTAMNGAFLRSWDSIGVSFGFAAYETAEKAYQDMEDKIKKSETLPSIVFVDGNLDADTGEWRKGDYFIRKVRSLEDIVQPTLVAHSTSNRENDAMMQAGANLAMEKGFKVSLRDYLNYFQGYLDDQKNK